MNENESLKKLTNDLNDLVNNCMQIKQVEEIPNINHKLKVL